MTDTVFWNVDTQYDFMRETYTDLDTMERHEGKLPVPGAEEIEDSLSALTSYAYREDIHVVNTADWHNEDTEEIAADPDYEETFPEHCMQDTPGAAYVPATSPQPADTYRVDWQDDNVDEDRLTAHRNTVLYKDKFDVFAGNPHTDDVLDLLDPDEIVVYGVATDVCVDYAVNGLLDRGYDVSFVADATAGLGEEDELQQVMDRWEEHGAERTTTREVVLGADHPFAGPGHEDRYMLYTGVVAHPQAAPTVTELQFVHPSMDDETVEQELAAMDTEYDILEQGELPETPVIDGEAYDTTFYHTTEEQWEEHKDLIGGANPEEVVSLLRMLRERMERPDWITELEQLPRGDLDG